jgi:hypothetical protein
MSRILLITLLTTLLGHANEMLMSVRTLAVEDGEMPVWYVAVENQKFEQLKWPANQPSAAIMAQAGGDLILYSKEVNQEGKAEFKLAKKVAIPEAAEELLLLGWPIKNDEKAGLIAIADNFKKAKFNDWLLINRSDQAVTLRYGKENDPISLESGESKTYQVKSEGSKGSEVIAETMMKGEMRKIYSTFWSAPDKQRSLVLFYSKDDRVKIQRIIDFLPEE